MEESSTSVPLAIQVEEASSRWDWVEPSVWTERMLSALEQGVKGGVWFTINGGTTPSLPSMGCTVCSPPTLRSCNPWWG